MRLRFTNNQQRAVALARRLLADCTDPFQLEDGDWHLLLLSAGVSGMRVCPSIEVAMRVLDHAQRRVGYFARTEPERQTSGTVTHWPGDFGEERDPWARNERGVVPAPGADARLGATGRDRSKQPLEPTGLAREPPQRSLRRRGRQLNSTASTRAQRDGNSAKNENCFGGSCRTGNWRCICPVGRAFG